MGCLDVLVYCEFSMLRACYMYHTEFRSYHSAGIYSGPSESISKSVCTVGTWVPSRL